MDPASETTAPGRYLLELYTVYSPPNHPDGMFHKNMAEAEGAEEKEHHK
jgi:hypothetical protein